MMQLELLVPGQALLIRTLQCQTLPYTRQWIILFK